MSDHLPSESAKSKPPVTKRLYVYGIEGGRD